MCSVSQLDLQGLKFRGFRVTSWIGFALQKSDPRNRAKTTKLKSSNDGWTSRLLDRPENPQPADPAIWKDIKAQMGNRARVHHFVKQVTGVRL